MYWQALVQDGNAHGRLSTQQVSSRRWPAALAMAVLLLAQLQAVLLRATLGIHGMSSHCERTTAVALTVVKIIQQVVARKHSPDFLRFCLQHGNAMVQS